MRLRVQVKAAAPHDQIWWDGSQLICRVTAIPQKGQSNRYLTEYLAKQFGIPKSGVNIESGHAARFKTININGSESKIRQVLAALPQTPVQTELF